MRSKRGIDIHTSQAGGRFIHKAYDYGIHGKNVDERVSEDTYKLFEKAMEALYDEMPNGSRDLKLSVTYKRPK